MNNLNLNRSLLDDNQAILNAWFDCALQIDMIHQCQQVKYEKNTTTLQTIGRE